MTFRSEVIIMRGLKPHRCDFCGSTIPRGVSSIKVVGRYDGSFYSFRGHEDCVQLWNEAYHDFSHEEGMSIDLCEALDYEEDRTTRQETYDSFRGHYPHVICRLELLWQRSEIHVLDRCRELGLDPDPEMEIYG